MNSEKMTDEYIKEKGLKPTKLRKAQLRLAILKGMQTTLNNAYSKVKQILKDTNGYIKTKY